MVDRIGPDSSKDPKRETVSGALSDFSQSKMTTKELSQRVGEYLHYEE